MYCQDLAGHGPSCATWTAPACARLYGSFGRRTKYLAGHTSEPVCEAQVKYDSNSFQTTPLESAFTRRCAAFYEALHRVI